MKTIVVDVPKEDVDVVLQFHDGQKIILQCRPSNADVGYEGSLDILLPYNQTVTCWMGDDMRPAPTMNAEYPETRFAKQLVLELPKKDKQTWTGCVGS